VIAANVDGAQARGTGGLGVNAAQGIQGLGHNSLIVSEGTTEVGV